MGEPRNGVRAGWRMLGVTLACAGCASGPNRPAAAEPVRCIADVRENPALCAKIDRLDQARRFQECAWVLAENGYHGAALEYSRYVERELTTGDFVRVQTLDGGLGSGSGENYIVKFRSGVHAIVKPRAAKPDARREAAAYRLDRLLDLNVVPATVVRRIGDREASVQYFVTNTDNGWTNFFRAKGDQIGFFDVLIGNADRHRGNWLFVHPIPLRGRRSYETDRRIAVDHDRTFEYGGERRPLPHGQSEQFIAMEDRFYRALKGASEERIVASLAPLLSGAQLFGLLHARNDVLRELCERRRARKRDC